MKNIGRRSLLEIITGSDVVISDLESDVNILAGSTTSFWDNGIEEWETFVPEIEDVKKEDKNSDWNDIFVRSFIRQWNHEFLEKNWEEHHLPHGGRQIVLGKNYSR